MLKEEDFGININRYVEGNNEVRSQQLFTHINNGDLLGL